MGTVFTITFKNPLNATQIFDATKFFSCLFHTSKKMLRFMSCKFNTLMEGLDKEAIRYLSLTKTEQRFDKHFLQVKTTKRSIVKNHVKNMMAMKKYIFVSIGSVIDLGISSP